MGQYRQWLHFREVDQRLRAQLERLSQELAELQAQANRFTLDEDVCTQNVIVQALATYLHVGPANGTAITPESIPSPTALPDLETVSPALFGWSHLPNLGLQEIRDPEPSTPDLPPLPVPRPRMNLLPDEAPTFPDGHGETAPQLSLPWWLRNVVDPSTLAPGNGPVDQQTQRTNRLVQRWLERWRTTEPPEQNESKEVQP